MGRSRKYHDLKNTHRADAEGVASIYGRAAEHTAKLVLIHAKSMEGTGVKQISLASVEWACSLVDHLVKEVVARIGAEIAETDVGKIKMKVMKFIRKTNAKNGNKGVSLGDIQRGPLAGGLAKDVSAILDSLVLSENIVRKEMKAPNGRMVVRIFAAK